MKILAVDDDAIILELLKEVVGAAGYTDIHVASSGAQALEMIDRASEPFDCFLLDIQMPEMDGIELCSRIRAFRQYAQSPVLMITAMSEKDYVERAFAAGATDYVTKPFDVMELCTRIKIAERMVSGLGVIEEKQFALDALKKQVEVQKRVAVNEEIPLAGVAGAIQRLAFENYVLQMGRSGLFGSAFIAFRITNIHRIHAQATASEFTHTILDVADIISEALKSREFFLCYRGNGIYAAVLNVGHARDGVDYADQIRTELRALDLCLENGAELAVDMKISDTVQCGLFQSSGPLEPLWQALEQVENGDRTLRRTTAHNSFRGRVRKITDQLMKNVAM